MVPANWLIAHDFTRRHGTALPDDHVLGMSASTQALAGATIRREIASAFDLGTGCGVQALYASAHATRVVASDLNPRAGACATLTMELNDVTNVAVRDGSLFDPVEGERFDLIVANPPFVISPSRRYLFRDNELRVDELCRQLVRSAPASPDRRRTLPSPGVVGARARARTGATGCTGWFDGTGCDALVLERETLEPSAHAASWLRQTEPPDQLGSPSTTRGWTYYEQHDIEAIGFGLITHAQASDGNAVVPRRGGASGLGDAVRRPSRSQCSSWPTSSTAPRTSNSLDVVAAGRARRRPRRTSPTGDGRCVGRRVERLGGDRPGAAPDRRAVLGGSGRRRLAAIVAACDGTRPLGAVLADAARIADVDPSDLARAAVPVFRRLVEHGFLLPVVDVSETQIFLFALHVESGR